MSALTLPLRAVGNEVLANERLAFVALIFLAPFQDIPGIEPDIILLAKLVIAALFVVQAHLRYAIDPLRIQARSVESTYLVYLAVALLSLFMSFEPGASIIAFTRLVMIFLLIRSFSETLRSEASIRLFISVLAVSVLITGGYAMAEFAQKPGRMSSFFVNANSLGQFSVLCLLAILGEVWLGRQRRIGRMFLIAALAFALAGLVLSFSRSSLIAMVVGISAMSWFVIGKRAIWYHAATAVLAGLLVIVYLEEVLLLFKIENVLSYRDVVWDITYRIFEDNPFLGIGPGVLSTQIGYYFSAPISSAHTIVWTINFSAHNDILQVLAETGGLGLIPYVAFLVHVGIRLVRQARSAERNSLAWRLAVTGTGLFFGFVAASVFETLFIYGGFSVAVVFWAYVSAAEGVGRVRSV